MKLVDVVSAHHERAVVRVGAVFVKVETDPVCAARERTALRFASIPRPALLWSDPGPPDVLVLSTVPGQPLGVLGQPSTRSAASWAAAGAAARALHETPVPDDAHGWFDPASLAAHIDQEQAWLVDHTDIARGVIDAHVTFAHDVLDDRRVDAVFMHGDLQAAHVFVDEHDRVTGVIDWGDAGPGDPLYDLACLSSGHGEHLDDVLRGYGDPVDLDVIRAYWTMRRLGAVRWMTEHGYDPAGDIATLNREAG